MIFSFFIPTYKRAESLRICITSIFKYWEGGKEIIISDNNEDDIAKNVVEKFDSDYIYYSSNMQNIGIDKNMLRFLELCKTRYCWLLGDDDSLNEKAYDSITPLLNDDLDFIILLNGIDVKGYESGIYDSSDIDKVGNAFISFWDKIPFGNIIVNVERARKVDFDKCYLKYLGTSHAYSGVLWELALSEFSSGKFGVITTPNIEVCDVTKTWTDSSVRIHFKEIPLWFGLLPKSIKIYTDKAYKKYLNRICSPFSILYFIRFCEHNKDNKKILKCSIDKMPLSYKINWFFVDLLFPIYKRYKKIKN